MRDSGVYRVARSPSPSIDATTTDEALVEGMTEDRPEAWREFLRRYERLILRCISKVTRRFSAFVMEEDVREIYATFLMTLLVNDKNKLRMFDSERGKRFSSWVGLLAINAAYDYLRGIRREPAKVTLAEAAEVACDLPDPYEVTAEHQRARVAARVVEGFSERDQEFFRLYFAERRTVYTKRHKLQSRLESALPGGEPEAPIAA
jgi:RNA polymerase sigma-70 factor (ECF subfamily)